MDNRIDSPSTVMTLQVGTTEQTRLVQEALPGRTVRTDHAWLAPRQPIPAHNPGANPIVVASHKVPVPREVLQTFENLMNKQRDGKRVEAGELRHLIAQTETLENMPVGALTDSDRSLLLKDPEVQDLRNWERELNALVPNHETGILANGEGAVKHVVKDIRQERTNACGESCVQALLAFHGREHDEFGTSNRPFHIGSSPGDLKAQLEERGVRTMYLEPAQPGQVSKQELRQWLAQSGPLLAWGKTHAVIIAGIEGDNVTIHCPLLGAREMSLHQLNDYLKWVGATPPLAATYKTLAAPTAFQSQPRPGRLAHFAVHVEAAAFAAKYHDWKPVKRNGQP